YGPRAAGCHHGGSRNRRGDHVGWRDAGALLSGGWRHARGQACPDARRVRACAVAGKPGLCRTRTAAAESASISGFRRATPQNALARRNEQNAQLIDADIIVEQNVRFAPESTSIADITSARWRIRDRERRQQFGSKTGLASNTDGPKKSRHHVVNCKARRHDGGSSPAGGGHVYHSRTDGGGPGVPPCRAHGSAVWLDGRGFD